MFKISMPLQRSAQAIAVAALVATLAACGGGNSETTESGAVQFASQMRALGAPQAQAMAPVQADIDIAVNADMVLDWAQYKFPDLFPKALAVRFPSIEYGGVTYNARVYVGAWGYRYLGVTPDGRVFGLGDFTGNALQQFETIAFWAPQVEADLCAVNPALCNGTNQPAGPLNDCTQAAAQALATGNRFVGTYAITGSSTGQYTIDSVVQGAGTFDGQAAVKVFSKIDSTTTAEGFTVSSTTETTTYEQDAGNGFARTLGFDAKVSTAGVVVPGVGNVGGTVTNTRTVFSPASVNVEFSIQPGASITKMTTSSTSTPGAPDIIDTSNTVHTFVARENITVRGRSYNTCRYTMRDASSEEATTAWVVINKGISVRTQTTITVNGQTRTETVELVNGTLNGAPV